MTAALLQDAGIAKSKLTTIPIGVDTVRFHSLPTDRAILRSQLGLPQDALILGSFQKDGVGWNDGAEPKLIKGPDILLDTVSRIHRHQPNLFVLLTGPARGYVKAGLDRLGVPYRHVQLTDYWNIVPYYQAIDFYLISSRCEGGPKALLESWACGVPVITTRIGMCADLVEDGVNGIIVESEDSNGLAEGARRLIDDPPFRTRLVQAGRNRVQDFDWNRIAGRHFEELYRPIFTEIS